MYQILYICVCVGESSKLRLKRGEEKQDGFFGDNARALQGSDKRGMEESERRIKRQDEDRVSDDGEQGHGGASGSIQRRRGAAESIAGGDIRNGRSVLEEQCRKHAVARSGHRGESGRGEAFGWVQQRGFAGGEYLWGNSSV